MKSVPSRLLAVLVALALALAACGSSDNSDPLAAGSGTGECPVGEGDALPALGDGTDTARGCVLPTIEGVDLVGDPMTIEAEGNAKVIVVMAHWCPHCQAEIPRIVEHLADTPMPENVDLIGLSTSANPSAPNYPPTLWLKKEKWTSPTFDDVDGTAAQSLGVNSFPFFVAVGPDGKVVARGSGELSMEQFDKLVTAAGAGKL